MGWDGSRRALRAAVTFLSGLDKPVDVLLEDPAILAGAIDFDNVNVQLLGEVSHRGCCQRGHLALGLWCGRGIIAGSL